VFNLVPLVIDTHDERAEWARLSRTIHLLGGAATGLGIPSGGGVIVHADTTIEALRRPRSSSVSRALASRTHCCAPKRAADWFARPVKPLNSLLAAPAGLELGQTSRLQKIGVACCPGTYPASPTMRNDEDQVQDRRAAVTTTW
jgi:hypothetical protein